MFRREIEGTTYSYDVAGLWGSGNTVTERELRATDENTVYTMWNGLGLTGPREGLYLEQYPALWGTLTFQGFLERFSSESDCMVWNGREETAEPTTECEEACSNVRDLCGDTAGAECLDRCDEMSDEMITCLAELTTCDPTSCQ